MGNLSRLLEFFPFTRRPPPFTHPNADVRWTIRANGSATLDVTREILYSRMPRTDELYDEIFASLDQDFEQLKYESDDAEIVDVASDKNSIRIYWRPRSIPIQPNIVYTHSYKWTPPGVAHPRYKQFTIASRVPTARYRLRIVSHRPVAEALCYKGHPRQNVLDPEEVMRNAREVERRGAPPPRKTGDKTFEVSIANVQPGERYFVIVEFEPPADGRPAPRLVVLVPGLARRIEPWTPLVERLKKEESLADAYWSIWDHGQSWYSFAEVEDVARDLRAHIDQLWQARGPFTDVILVGHSLGGLLVRKAYLDASAADDRPRRRTEWAGCVSRIILFAGINRGVDNKSRLRNRVGAWFARAFPILRRCLAWDLLRGSDFITDVRIQWIRYFSTLGDSAPLVVQLLGTRDDLIEREDSIDVEQFPTAHHIEVPGAEHHNVFELGVGSSADDRYALLRQAFVRQRSDVRSEEPQSEPKDIVFVVHGIRANNQTWVKDTLEKIASTWPHVEVIDPRYPFLSALRFAIPMTRRRELQWFRDAYSQALARHPHASFSFIGHSNGTYIFGESLRAIPAMKFRRAVLVGSVLPADYDWEERVRRGQLESLRVDCSAYDWPVGWLCSLLRGAGMKDVGTGGYEGFTRLNGVQKHEYLWYKGGHSAPLASENLGALAEFAVLGSIIPPGNLEPETRWFTFVSRLLHRLAPIVVLGIGACFILLLATTWTVALSILLALTCAVILLDVT